MDPVYLIWLFGFGALIGGGIIGVIAYRNLAPNRNEASNLKAELDQARQAMESYKASVNSHFDKTSELVNELTQDYVKVYKHLAQGAQTLGDNRDFTNMLEQHQGKVLISVDNEPEMQDTIVSEPSADTAEPQETAQVSSELIDEVVAAEDISDRSEDIAARVSSSDAPESPLQRDEKKEPVLEAVTSAPRHDDSVAVARPVAGSGNDGAESHPVAKPRNKKKAVASASAKTEAEPA